MLSKQRLTPVLYPFAKWTYHYWPLQLTVLAKRVLHCRFCEVRACWYFHPDISYHL